MELYKKQTKKRPKKIEPTSGVKRRKLTVSNTNNTKKPRPKEINENESSNTATCSFGDNSNESGCEEYVLLAEQHNLDVNTAKNIVKLFEDGNTIPFIARYRRNLTSNMSPEELRDVKNTYDSILILKSKIQTVLKTIEKTGKLDSTLKCSVLSVRSLDELDYIYAPFKPESKRTLANKARELGLEGPALNVLGNKKVALNSYVDSSNVELNTLEKVRKGITHIIASIISTDSEMLTFIRKLRFETNFIIKTKLAKKTSKATSKMQKDDVDPTKFENYYDFTIPIKYIKPHQILAINRGESQKVLSVKIEVPEWFYKQFEKFCLNKWVRSKVFEQEAKDLIVEAIEDSYTRLVQPLIIREIRNELKNSAEKASCDVFSTNLKHLLLAQPVKGRRILAMDPGFKNGCKVAVVSETGGVLEYTVIHPLKENSRKATETLKNLLQKYGCNLIALGNGTACRETEGWLSKLLEKDTFSPLDVTYLIVNENGVSIYSCSPEAKKEFSDLDPNMISAISLARRVQDPLAELVKVEPRHLGIGMYQHDLKATKLKEALNEVISECVSFVGVDLNTASQCLLGHVAGLSQKRAQLIVDYREKHGIFTSRAQLKDIKTIGEQTFQQCIGFLRVGPTDDEQDFYKLPKTNRLDRTYIHPESYQTAEKLIKLLGLDIKNIGQNDFIETIKSKCNVDELTKKLNTPKETIKLIVDVLGEPLNYDFRTNFKEAPLFKKGLTKITELSTNSVLTGRVNNVTHFGCFVDIGVGTNGLIHTNKMKGVDLQIGDKVEVKVLNVDLQRKRIQLETVRKLC